MYFRPMKKFFIYIVSFLSLLLFVGAGRVEVSDFTANVPNSSPNEIMLKWVTTLEVGVDHYELKRKMINDSDFKFLTNVNTASTLGSTNKVYKYTDKSVFKSTTGSEPVVYALYAVFSDGQVKYIGQAEVNYTTTAIRRTWGSIKAMFQ